MKITDILVDYLLRNKALALPGLGRFTLKETGYVLPDGDKKPGIPPGAVSFELDKSAPEDPELLAEISRLTGKIRPLASSDLEALIIQGKQLLNISKPFMIEGLGSLQKNHRGEIEFIPYIADEMRPAGELRSEEPGEPIKFSENYLRPQPKSTGGSRNLALAALAAVGLGIMIWVGYYFYQRSASDDGQPLITLNEAVAIPDSTATAQENIVPPPSDSANTSSAPVIDTVQSTIAAPAAIETPGSSESFNIVLEYAKKERALKRYADLREWGHKAQMVTSDSNTFKIFLPIKAPLSDSTRHRDSLSRFFGRKVWVEKP